MTIDGSSLYSSMYSTSNIWSQLSTQDVEGTQQGVKGPGGQGGPPPPPQGGPDLDTDSDGYWSETEISEFSSEMSLSLDTESIMSTYDTDGDGLISADEREAMKSDNALNLPPPQDMTEMKQDFQSFSEGTTASSDLLAQMMQAYLSQSDSSDTSMYSLFDVAL